MSLQHRLVARTRSAARASAAAPVVALACALALVVTAADAHAGPRVQVQGGAGFGRVGGELVSAVDATVDVALGRFALQLRAPLRSQLTGARPPGTSEGSLRPRDWDERSEWLRLAPKLTWSRPQGDGRLPGVSLRVAPTAGATLGHGSVVRGYRSALLQDHFASALRLDVDSDAVGLQLLVADVTRAELVAARLFARPLSRWLSRGPWRDLTFGITAAADRSAPLETLRDGAGQARVTASGRPVQRSAPLVIVGLDLGLPVRLPGRAHLVPYVDVNVATVDGGGGVGVHGGLWWSWRADFADVRARWELRRAEGAYRPGWVDGFYALERMQLGTQTKASAWLGRAGTGRWGHLVEARVATHGGWRGRASWETWHSDDLLRPQDTAAVQLSSPTWRGLQGQAAWALRPGQGQQVVAAAAAWQSTGPWRAWLDVQRSWHADAGRYDLTWNASVGAGARWTW